MSKWVQGSAESVSHRHLTLFSCSVLISSRECDRAIARHEEWLVLRERAIANHHASGSAAPLPKSLTTEPPPRPEPYVDEGACDVSVDMIANGFDISESFTMEKSQADEVVPIGDPGMEARTVSYVSTKNRRV